VRKPKPKSSASPVRQRITQWHNQSTLFTYHHNWTTDVWRPTCELTLTRYIRCHGVGQKKRDLTWNQITFTSTLIRHSLSGSVHASSWPASVSVTEIVLNGFSIKTSPIVTCIGVKIYAELTFSTHVKQVAARCFYYSFANCGPFDQLLLFTDNAIMLIHAVIASPVDYTVTLFQTAAVYLRPLQSVMNAAARLVVKKRKSDSITLILRDTLHWLLVRERIDFKLCLLVYKCLQQLAAPYLESMIFSVSAVSLCQHVTTYGRQVKVTWQYWGPELQSVGFSSRSFSVAGPSL